MTRKIGSFTLSHDAKDLKTYTHRSYVLPTALAGKIVCIQDDQREHLRFLRGWLNCEIDIETKWSLNSGVFMTEIKLSHGNNSVFYITKLTVEMVKKILSHRLNAMGVCDSNKKPILYFRPLQVDNLFELYVIKQETDLFMKKRNINHPGWHVD